MDQTKSELLTIIETLKTQQEHTSVKLQLLQDELPKLRSELETLKSIILSKDKPLDE